jgi:glycine cleavage system H protein
MSPQREREQALYPEDLKYTADHEWVRVVDATTIRVGITHYAQDALGDVVYVSLPVVGSELIAGDPCGELESTKSVSDVIAPIAGTVTALNDLLDGAPELVNSDPYGDGWLFDVSLSDASQLEGLLDVANYTAQLTV